MSLVTQTYFFHQTSLFVSSDKGVFTKKNAVVGKYSWLKFITNMGKIGQSLLLTIFLHYIK